MGVVANLVVKISASISDFEKQMAGLERSFSKSGDRLKGIGRDLTIGLTAPLTAIGALSVKAAMDFESSFAGVRKTVDGVVDAGGNLTAFGKKLQQDFRDLAKEIPVSVNELNRIGESAGQLGIKSESILGFTKTIAAMATATNLSAEQAADGMARFANITQMPQDHIQNLGSVIVELGNKLAATESEILDFGLRIAGAGEIVGMTESAIMGIAGAFSSVGIEAEAGGTAVQKALMAMNSAVQAGKAGGFGQIAGMGGDQFGALFNQNPAEAFNKFVEGIGAAGKGGEALLKGVGIDDARQVRAFLSLASAGDLLRNSLKLASDEWVRNTALANEAAQRYRTFESQLTLLKNKAYDLAITFGTSLIESIKRMWPAIETVVGGLAKAVDWFSKLPQPVQTAAFALGGLAAALGPIAYVVGTIMTTGGALVKVFTGWGGAATKTAGEVGLLSRALAGLAGLGGAALSGVGLLVGGLVAQVSELTREGGPRFQTGFAGGTTGAYGAITSMPKVGSPDLFKGGGIGPLTDGLAMLGKESELLPVKLAAVQGGIAGVGGAGATAAPQISAFEQGVRSLTERIGGDEVIASAEQWIEGVKRIGGVGALTQNELEQFTQAIADAVEKMLLLGQVVPASWLAIANTIRTNPLLAATQDMLGDSLKGGLNRQQLLLPGSSMDTGSLMNIVPPAIGNQNASAGVYAAAQGMGASFTAGWQASIGALPQTILAAFAGGGNVGQSIGALLGGNLTEGLGKSLGSSLSGMLGKTLGGAIGSVIPGIGSLLGSMIGPLLGKMAGKLWNGIQSIFGNDEEARQVNPARDTFLSQFGPGGTGAGSGFMNLAAQLTTATGEEGGGSLFHALTQADTMAEFNAAVSAIQAKLNETHQQNTAGFQSTETAASGLNMTVQGSDEAIAALGATQDRVVQSMLAGFDALMAKLTEFIGLLTGAQGMIGGLSMPGVPIPGELARSESPYTAEEIIAQANDPTNAHLMDVVPSDMQFADGGPVPRTGLALVHGGEHVLTQNEAATSGGLTININAGTLLGNPAELAAFVLDAIERGGHSMTKFRILSAQAAGA